MYFKYVFVVFSLLFTNTLLFSNDTQRQALKTNGELVYDKVKDVNSLTDMFLDGDLYARLRSNNFYFLYNNPDTGHEDQFVTALGGSIVYNSAKYNGFDIKIAGYGSKSYFDESAIDQISHLKPAKDTLSRLNYSNDKRTYFGVLGQLNIGYTYSKTNFRLGRQLVETFYTKSNDTKMVPNTFDGIVVSSKDLEDTKIKFAYLYEQKLRDHTTSHSVLMVGDSKSSSKDNPQWTENDDSAMHRGLTYSALKAEGKPTDAPLIVLDIENKSINYLKINFASYVVPELLSQAMGELNYKVKFDGFSITPGFRYLQQFDNGAGKVGGASIYKVGLNSYKDKNSLNSKMIAARLVANIDDYKINLAYTNILDEADLVTPWRGFPTSGYTRSMGIYNWRANTKSYRLELVKGANKTGVYKKPFLQISALFVDGDEQKIETESMFYYAGIVQNIPAFPSLQYRLRLGYRDFVGSSSKISNYLDSRFELNYLF